MKLRSIMTAIPLAAVLLAGAPIEASGQNAEERVKLSVDAVGSESQGASFVRPNIFYKLGSVDGFTFIEFYSDKTYFGKTMLSKEIGRMFSLTGELAYGSSDANSARLGAKYSVPMPKGSEFEVKALPLWLDKDGRNKKAVVGYYGSAKLPAGFDVSSFGEIDALNAEWMYGEFSIGKNFGKSGKIGIHYNPLLKSNGTGKLMPRVEHAIRASYKF
ncbi:MAG TPA: hypothetical protein VJH04_02575 [archaeon]|nr:hypothetical protein [archaeon]